MTSPTIARLALANFVARRARFALTICAVALSVALVVSITSGYASLERAIRSFVDDFIGSVDFEVTTPGDPRPAIAPDVLDRLRADPRVANVTARIEAFATPLGKDGIPMQSARALLFGVADDPASVGRLPRMDDGRFLLPGERGAICVDGNTLDSMDAKLGDIVTFEGPGEPLQLKIVGVVHKPAMLKMFFRSGYVSIDQLRDFIAPDRPGYVTKVRGEFDVSVDSAAFAQTWDASLKARDERYEFRLIRDSRADLDQNLLGLRLASYLGSTVSLASAAFIILASLMTGVQEQHRQLAMLRAIGATRWQVGRLVCLEGLFIGLTGALIGIPMGVAGLYLVSAVYPHVFDGGVTLAPMGMLYALLVAALASLVASAIPAYWASRAKPMEAMTNATDDDRTGRLPWRWIALGAALVSIDSLLIFGPVEPVLRTLGLDPTLGREVRLFGHILVGVPGILLGALLVAPLVVRGVELLGNLVLPVLMRLPAPLLKQQLTESPWRSAATGVALMIGLTLLITMNAQGRSALGAWQLPTKFFDVLILPDAAYGSISLRPKEIDLIRDLPEIVPGKIMPITANAQTLGAKIFDVAGTAMPDRTMFIGVDPNVAFEMMQLDFRDGDEATAKRMMVGGRQIKLKDGTTLHATVDRADADDLTVTLLGGEHRTVAAADVSKNEPGRYLIVTEEFRKLRGFRVGDTFGMESGLFITRKIDFVIVAVVWSPGMDVMLNTFDLPARVKEQTAATVFGTLEDGRTGFGMTDAFAIVANLKPGIERDQLLDRLRKTLGREGLIVADVRQVKHDIETVFNRLLGFASSVAWMAMFVATLGVGNAIVAGIRTRQWRLGVLRSIGLTRAELLRLLLAEALLLSLVGVVLGVGFGLVLATNAKHLYSVALGFDPPLIIPWDLVALGSIVIVTLGLLATILPAIMAARREPLSLLQAGRAGT